MLYNISNSSIDILNDEILLQKELSMAVLRLDKIHPVVSGNKLFKLHYFLQEAGTSSHKTILTFGGAFSNHLVATAYACKAAGLKSIGIVRGEKPYDLSPALQHCIHYGMQLKYVSRKVFATKEETFFTDDLYNEFGDCTIIPEGGYNSTGANGAALIWNVIPPDTYSHIVTATGTATTLAGILSGAKNETIISVPVLKGMTDIESRITFCGAANKLDQLQIAADYHFGGYAKKNTELLAFMNALWQGQQIPTDFVYTGKMLYAVFDLVNKDHFPPGSAILCLHTGGLQGNLSLPEHSLLY